MITGFIILGLFAGAWVFLSERWRLAFLRRRHDHERLWLAAVPAVEQNRLSELLAAICDAFMIPLRYRFRLRPSDDLQVIYRRNKQGQLGDSLEYENLALRLEESFGLDVEQLYGKQPCTVGILVRSIIDPRSKKTTGAAPKRGSGTPANNPGPTKRPPS